MQDIFKEEYKMSIMDEIERGGVIKKTYFVQAENAFIKNTAYTSHEKLLYLILCTYAGKGNSCFPSQKVLGEMLGLSRTRANEIMKALEKKNGVYIVNTKYPNNRKGPNIYFLAEVNKYTGYFMESSLTEYKEYFKGETQIISEKKEAK